MAKKSYNGDPTPRPGTRITLRVVAGIVTILTAGALGAQTVPTGVQEYFILGWEQHIWDMMDEVQNDQGGAQFDEGMNSVITATGSADNQLVFYDHWEDGLDPALAAFPTITPPLQQSTLVIGDADDSNGEACDFSANIACGGVNDVLSAGDYINFNSDQGLVSNGDPACAVPSAHPNYTQLCNAVELSPRCADPDNCADSEFRFDGGDMIRTTGGPLSLIHSQYPLTQYIGGSTEILSRQAVEAARSYSVPIGEDLYANNTVTEPFHFVHLDLVAFEDTQITVESPGAGNVSFSLSRGEHWSSMGYVDESPQPALAITINAGTKVSTTAPISGMIFTGGNGTWATRHYALLPDILHSTDYLTTAPGDDPGVGNPADRPANVYILNPDQLSDIVVSITDSSGTYNVTIPPNEMRSMDDVGGGLNIAPGSTVRMTSDRNFWGVTAYDWNTNVSDWGHSWLAKKFLTRTYTVSFGPGNQDPTDPGPPPAGTLWANPVFVAATEDRTRVQFDLDNNHVYDLVDLNGDGAADAADDPVTNTYFLSTPDAFKVWDPNDNDMTGARIIANKPIAVSWGQETENTEFSDWALDTGFTIYPVNQLFLDPALVIDKVTDINVVPINPIDPDERIVTYTLTVTSFDFGPLTNGEVFDILPIGVAGADYIQDSTLITYPNLVQDMVNPTASIDPATGRDRLDWTLTSAPPAQPEPPPNPPFSFGLNNTITVRYQVRIPPAPGSIPRLLINEGHAEARLGGSTFSPFDSAAVVQTDVELTKSTSTTNPGPSDVITFTINVLNDGSTDETGVIISDAIPPDTTYCDSSIDAACTDPTGTTPFTSGSFDAAQNAVIWSAGTLLAGASATLTFDVKVNPTSRAGTRIPNRAGYESIETPYFLSNEVEPVVEGSVLTAVKSIIGNPPLVHPYELVTFNILLANTGSAAANNVRIIDQFPLNATYIPGSMQFSLNSGGFTSLTDADDGDEGGGAEGILNATNLEFRLASLGVAENVNLRFKAVVDPGTAGSYLFNQAIFASDETPSTDTNAVQVPIVGDAQIDGHVFLDIDGDGVQDPGEPDIANVDVVVTDPTGVTQRVSTDANGDYTAVVDVISSSLGCYLDQVSAVAYNGSDGSLNWSATSWTEYGLGADGNPATNPMLVAGDPQGAPGNNTLRIQGGGGSAATRGFTRAVDLDPGDSATLTFRYFRLDFEADDEITLEIDYGSGFSAVPGGVFGQPPGGENDGQWQNAIFTLDAAQLPADPVTLRLRSTGGFGFANDEFYFDDVQICVTSVTDADVTLNVDESDPDFPPGAVLTTANDPQIVAATKGGTVTAPDVGYQQTELTFTKVSDAVNHEVSPGQTITYTLDITNNTGTTQTGIVVTDAVPTGTTYVAGSSQIDLPTTPISVRVAASTDDAEENVVGGGMSLTSSDLEMAFDGDTEEIKGMRFLNLAIPPGSTILNANIVFQADESDAGATNLIIYGQAVDDALTFSSSAFDISSRPTTSATVSWVNLPPWSTNGNYQTPDISGVIQEIIDRPGWASGNSIVTMVAAGAGCVDTNCERTAESWNGESANAPLLQVTLASSAAAGDPPALLNGTAGYTLAGGETLTLTFQVVVDDPLAAGITQIINNAALSTDQQGPYNASVTDDVILAGVVVEYDNAGFDLVGQAVTYAHVVTNTGAGDDSFDITTTSEEGWRVDLIDPDSGAIIATDADGDGVWDNGVTINTGTLSPGEFVEYQLQVTIPAGVTPGDPDATESTGLIATSDRNPRLVGIATDETVAVDALDPVIFLPDNSGVASAGGSIAYSHRVLNNTGVPETFDLTAVSLATPTPWTATYYWDSNGDGVYTAGVDIAITNTRQLAQGESQLVFLVVDVPSGTPDLTVDVAHLTAFARSDPDNVFATSTDTTTVEPPTILDLSGGGTRSVIAGATAVYPGTIRNFTNVDDLLTFDITESWFYGFDGLDHPTELWIDTDSDGIPDTKIAEDLEGDGAWDDDNGLPLVPSVTVPAGGELAYELRRPIDPSQGPSRDPVTLTITSSNTGEIDNVTATTLLAAATRAILASFDAFSINGQVVVEWRTAAEIGTLGFDLLRRRDGEEWFSRVNDSLIRGGNGHLQGGTYRLRDAGASLGETVTYVLMEHDVWGVGTRLGPYDVTIGQRSASKEHAKALAVGLSYTVNTSNVRRPSFEKATPIGDPSGMAKILVGERGLTWVSAEELASALDTDPTTVSGWIEHANLWIADKPVQPVHSSLIFADGFESGGTQPWGAPADNPDDPDEPHGVAWVAAADNTSIYFFGEPVESIYTPHNVYWLGVGSGDTVVRRDASTNGEPAVHSFAETLHFEHDNWPLTAVMTDPEADYWMWDYFFPWQSDPPGYGEPVVSKTFVLTVPGVAPTGADARLTVNLQGSFITTEASPNHVVEVRLNGSPVSGPRLWSGHDVLNLELAFPQSLLVEGDNTVELTTQLVDGLDFDEFYLDSFDLSYSRLFYAHEDRLLATGSGEPEITVAGFTSPGILVFDLTDPLQPVMLDPTRVQPASGSYMVSFSTGGLAFPFLATTSAGSRPAAGIVTDLASDLSNPGNRGRWIVVAGTGLEGQAAILAAHRAGHGLSSVVARVADIYDEFNDGVASPWAIHDFLRYASENWSEPPEYVFLAGDGTFDHKDNWGGAEDLVPAPMAVTGDGLVPSDNLLADWIDADGVPEVAIGRFPAQSPSEIAAYTDKVIAFEAAIGPWKKHTLWLEDDPDLGGEFIDDMDSLLGHLPTSYTYQRTSLDDLEPPDAWEETQERIANGAILINFLGHGGFDRLAEEGLLVTEDAVNLENYGKTPFVSALTCIVGRFDVPDYDTLAEALLLNDGGGAIAVWSPSGYSMNTDATLLGERYLTAIASGAHSTIGDAVLDALRSYLADGRGDGALPQKFVLLGDPATRVDW